jgi:hypothetical protein
MRRKTVGFSEETTTIGAVQNACWKCLAHRDLKKSNTFFFERKAKDLP